MIELIQRETQCIQLSEITMEVLCKFYERIDNQKKILLVYDHQDYFSNIGYEEAEGLCDKDELIGFLYLCKGKSVNNGQYAQNDAEVMFKNNPYIHYILVNDKQKNCTEQKNFYCDIVQVLEEYKENIRSLINILKTKKIHTYSVRIPQIDDIKDDMQHTEWKFGSIMSKMNWTKMREDELKIYLRKITELKYDDAKERVIYGEKTKKCKNEKLLRRTIFLVGPCIVGGWETFQGESLYDKFYECLMKLKLNYNIVEVVIGRAPSLNTREILEYDIKRNDIVIFLDDIIDKDTADIDLDYLYNNYRGDKWLYTDEPIHTTSKGNELIAYELLQNVIKPIADISEAKYDNNILHKGKKQLTYGESIALQKYLSCAKRYSNEAYNVIGACVVTCNPFTKGHYYLIESASKQVDFLYVFVVEEDAVYFSFEDRIEMVRRGVKDLKNVIVLPSGRFIISKDTFKNYFEKELYPDAVIDATRDTMIFRNYIVPELRITKRFVGEEPEDKITNQYNESLKKDLSDAVEVVEIPRKKVAGKIISASKVRNYLEEKEWEEIENMVPQSTLDYLKNNISKTANKKMEDKTLDRIIEYIQCHSNIVVCGLGKDAKDLIEHLEKRLDISEIKKLEFYDRKAAQSGYSYKGKKVINFEELIMKYGNYYMLIATRKYKQDIFFSLIKNNIDPKRIFVVNACI